MVDSAIPRDQHRSRHHAGADRALGQINRLQKTGSNHQRLMKGFIIFVFVSTIVVGGYRNIQSSAYNEGKLCMKEGIERWGWSARKAYSACEL